MMREIVVETNYGALQGTEQNEMLTFLDIPYARYERFLPAIEPERWTGIRDATKYGHCQPQARQKFWDTSEVEYSEQKGLNLNIWTPACDDKKRAVLVWIHGGGNVEGANRVPFWDGPHLVGGHDMVMVSISYRVGFLGNLYLGDLLGKKYAASGSLMDYDKIMALRWINAHIERFGGDPDNITIMGQSGGAKSAGNLIVSPMAKGLFQKAIMISGCAQCIRDVHTANVITERFLEMCGIPLEQPEQILTYPVEEIIRVQTAYRKKYPHVFGPTLDGILYTLPAREYLSTGASDRLKVLIGYTWEEKGHWAEPYVSPDNRRIHLKEKYGLNSKRVIELYDEFLKDGPEYDAYNRINNLFYYANESIEFAEMLSLRAIPTWCYRWDFHGDECARHLTDLSYIFRTTKEEDPIFGHSHQYDNLSPMMNQTFMSFAKYGDPNNELIPKWLPYTNPTNGTRMYLSDYPSAESFSLERYDHEFNFMEFQL